KNMSRQEQLNFFDLSSVVSFVIRSLRTTNIMFNPQLMSRGSGCCVGLSPTLPAVGVDGFSVLGTSGLTENRRGDPREGGKSREVFLSRVREFYIQTLMGPNV